MSDIRCETRSRMKKKQLCITINHGLWGGWLNPLNPLLSAPMYLYNDWAFWSSENLRGKGEREKTIRQKTAAIMTNYTRSSKPIYFIIFSFFFMYFLQQAQCVHARGCISTNYPLFARQRLNSAWFTRIWAERMSYCYTYIPIKCITYIPIVTVQDTYWK